ncbi:hypothetical protein FSP39_014941 [Pinctada imbricata]|uniref:SAM domain-containing protein n=1 Tax=Pinctada imbricata TaxID=66713 RepID=A0AA89C1J3_PINIB|nr:hypothetical protein FSP39_014941 [Pinctada imbricata]
MGDDKYHRAARDGYVDLLKEATKRDLNLTDEDGMVPAHWAAYHGNVDALRTIVGRGGDPDKPDLLGFTSLHHACRNGHMNAVSFLVNYGCNIWSLDNEYHTAMDIAALGGKENIVSALDGEHARQKRLNPKSAEQQSQRAVKLADQNIKRYEQRQREAARYAEREQRRIQAETDPDFKPPSGKNFFKTLTMRFKNNKGTRRYSSNQNGVTSFSEMTQQSTKRGIGRKILQKKASQDTASINDFRISERDSSGNRTLRSVGGGFRKNSDVLYLTNRENDAQSGARKPLQGLFPGGMQRNKSKSENDLLDSGFEDNSNSSNNNEEDDEENKPGLLFRPGMGQISFLKSHGMAGTLSSMTRSASYDPLSAPDSAVNHGHTDSVDGGDPANKRKSGSSDSIGTTTSLEERMKETLPWNPDEVCSDDEEEDTETSALIRFLEACDLNHYTRLFNEQEIDLQALMLLSDDDMEKLGLKIGPRKKLQIAIKKRQEVLDNPLPLRDSHL